MTKPTKTEDAVFIMPNPMLGDREYCIHNSIDKESFVKEVLEYFSMDNIDDCEKEFKKDVKNTFKHISKTNDELLVKIARNNKHVVIIGKELGTMELFKYIKSKDSYFTYFSRDDVKKAEELKSKKDILDENENLKEVIEHIRKVAEKKKVFL